MKVRVFIRHSFTSGGQGSGSVFSAAVCKIQASKHCWKLKKKLLFTRWKVHCTAASWPRACPLEVRCLIGIWKLSIPKSHDCHGQWLWMEVSIAVQLYICCYTSVWFPTQVYSVYSVPLFIFIWRQSGPRLEPLRPGRAGWTGMGFLQDCDIIIWWNGCYFRNL